MNEYLHPRSNQPIRGMRLASGATLQETDRYDCFDGEWRTAGSIGMAGHTLRAGQPAIWIRPAAEISAEGRVLLRYLVRQPGYGLTARGSMWIVVPSPRWKYDGRMQWEVQHPECIPELIEYGLIAAQPVGLSPEDLPWECAWPQPGDAIYYLTEAGQIEGAR